jgi:hypothetical protein
MMMSSTEARRFGLITMLVLFAAALWQWLRRHHPTAALAAGVLGALFALAGFVWPPPVIALRRGLLLVGRMNAMLLLVVIFWLVFTPVGLARRLARRRRPSPAGWKPYEKRAHDHFEHPY